MYLPIRCLLAGLLALSAGPALAETADGGTAGDAPFGAVSPVTGTALATITGKAETDMVVRAQNSSNVSNNSVSGYSETGTISFDAQSFQNMSGLSLLSANTGNNVSINSSLNVNVAIQR